MLIAIALFLLAGLGAFIFATITDNKFAQKIAYGLLILAFVLMFAFLLLNR